MLEQQIVEPQSPLITPEVAREALLLALCSTKDGTALVGKWFLDARNCTEFKTMFSADDAADLLAMQRGPALAELRGRAEHLNRLHSKLPDQSDASYGAMAPQFVEYLRMPSDPLLLAMTARAMENVTLADFDSDWFIQASLNSDFLNKLFTENRQALTAYVAAVEEDENGKPLTPEGLQRRFAAEDKETARIFASIIDTSTSLTNQVTNSYSRMAYEANLRSQKFIRETAQTPAIALSDNEETRIDIGMPIYRRQRRPVVRLAENPAINAQIPEVIAALEQQRGITLPSELKRGVKKFFRAKHILDGMLNGRLVHGRTNVLLEPTFAVIQYVAMTTGEALSHLPPPKLTQEQQTYDALPRSEKRSRAGLAPE